MGENKYRNINGFLPDAPLVRRTEPKRSLQEQVDEDYIVKEGSDRIGTISFILGLMCAERTVVALACGCRRMESASKPYELYPRNREFDLSAASHVPARGQLR